MNNRNARVWTTNDHHYRMSASSRIQSAVSNSVDDNKSNNFENNPYLVGVQSKFRRKYYHKVVFATLISIIIILIIALICIAVQDKYFINDVCETKECLRSASNLLLTMDQTIDPCDDFYQFTCGHWSDEHPRPDSVTSYDWFSEKQTKIIRKIREYLKTNITNAEPEAVIKTKIMYQACNNIDGINKLGISPVLNYLKELKLPLIPSILNITENYTNETIKFDWVETLAKIKRTIGMDILIGFDIFPDPENRTINQIAFGTPESGSPLPFNDGDNHIHIKRAQKKFFKELNENENDDEIEISPAVTAYLAYIRKVILVLIVSINPEVNVEELIDRTTNVAVETVRISKNFYKIKEDIENITKLSQQTPLEDLLYVTVTELQNFTDISIQPESLSIWEKYLKTLTEDIPEIRFGFDNKKILTSKADLKYLQTLVQLITEMSTDSLELYIWWNIVEELILHTTSDLRELHNEYTRLVIKTEGTTSRSIYCTTGVNSLMGMAVSYAIADKKFLNETHPKVENMLKNIRTAFNQLVKSTNWMDETTKMETLEKSANMQSFIGFPEWILNKTKLDQFYNEIKVNNNTHLDNMIGILKWQMKKKIKNIIKTNEFGWATSPSNVNAFHSFQANTITVPMAILQYPFYELGLEALNYGAIGTILGHELTHGFDDSGRMFDKSGNMRQWWSNKTITEYINRTECFIKQYGKYYLPDIDEYVNGELTLGENIADNGGLREAYYGYKILVNNMGKENRLPGLEQFNHEQLFFIAFGNIWCESYTPAGSRYALEDSHCPGQIRLKGVLSNSPEFSKAFKCRKGSGMYPADERCRIW